MNTLVRKIEKEINSHFENSTFRLEEKNFGNFIINGDDISTALNNYNDETFSVNVLRWFDDFWIYFEILFSKIDLNAELANFKPSEREKKESYKELVSRNNLSIEKSLYRVILTFSVFQGTYKDDVKKQLFRAEWDNYDDNDIHPQPHWHFYPHKEDSELSKDFSPENFTALLELSKELGGFDEQLGDTEKGYESIDIKKFHFAMSGQWADNQSHIHKINNELVLINWINGMLSHIKEQLNFVKS